MIIWGRSVGFLNCKLLIYITNSLIYRNLFGLFGRGSGRGSVYWRGYEYLRYDGPMSPCASRWYYHGLAMGKSSGISVLSISKMFSVWFGSSSPRKNQNTLQRDLRLMNYDPMKYMSKAKFWEYENMANFEALNFL